MTNTPNPKLFGKVMDRRTAIKALGAITAFGAAVGISPRTIAAHSHRKVRRNASLMADDDPFFTNYSACHREDAQTFARNDASYLAGAFGADWAISIHCPHGTIEDFLPWHTGYTFLISENRYVLPSLGNSDFALAYWDWTTNRRLPSQDHSSRQRGRLRRR